MFANAFLNKSLLSVASAMTSVKYKLHWCHFSLRSSCLWWRILTTRLIVNPESQSPIITDHCMLKFASLSELQSCHLSFHMAFATQLKQVQQVQTNDSRFSLQSKTSQDFFCGIKVSATKKKQTSLEGFSYATMHCSTCISHHHHQNHHHNWPSSASIKMSSTNTNV